MMRRVIIGILIVIFIWILLFSLQQQRQRQQREGAKGFKKLGKSIAKTTKTATKAITKTANQVGGEIAKIATMGMSSDTKAVLKNLGKIRKALSSFTKKGDPLIPIMSEPAIPLVASKCIQI